LNKTFLSKQELGHLVSHYGGEASTQPALSSRSVVSIDYAKVSEKVMGIEGAKKQQFDKMR